MLLQLLRQRHRKGRCPYRILFGELVPYIFSEGFLFLFVAEAGQLRLTSEAEEFGALDVLGVFANFGELMVEGFESFLVLELCEEGFVSFLFVAFGFGEFFFLFEEFGLVGGVFFLVIHFFFFFFFFFFFVVVVVVVDFAFRALVIRTTRSPQIDVLEILLLLRTQIQIPRRRIHSHTSAHTRHADTATASGNDVGSGSTPTVLKHGPSIQKMRVLKRLFVEGDFAHGGILAIVVVAEIA
mmetsp:Transcript_709/g.1515  ORF Transcript_709/g.1515 Transcript_709/m.1515 type:complete len:240 (-) Transcript_709:919-1638(-)